MIGGLAGWGMSGWWAVAESRGGVAATRQDRNRCVFALHRASTVLGSDDALLCGMRGIVLAGIMRIIRHPNVCQLEVHCTARGTRLRDQAEGLTE